MVLDPGRPAEQELQRPERQRKAAAVATTMIGWFRERVASKGDEDALMYRGEDDLFTTMTWVEIERRVNALAASLAKMGVQGLP